ncbi:MAG: alpha/beta hydrolase [Myxococcales bacterium]|nr:alpha/beta hydrolase [Myxococcales bacterium]
MQPRSVTFTGAGGVRLVGDEVGPADAAPVLLLHGGGQTRHAWGATARALAAAGHRVVAIDHRGHGDSGWPDDGDYGLETFAADVCEVAAQLGAPPVVVGASLGGLAGLLAEGERGPVLRALVLVDVAPRMEAGGVARIIGFMQSGLDGFASLEEAADAIAAYLPHRRRPRDLGGLSKNLRQRPDGRWRWHWDPRFVRRDGRDRAFSRERLDGAAHRLRVPTLLVRGRMSEVLSEDGVRELRALVPHAAYVDVAAAHMVAGDDNDAFSTAVVDFLAGLDVDGGAADQIARSRPAQ